MTHQMSRYCATISLSVGSTPVKALIREWREQPFETSIKYAALTEDGARGTPMIRLTIDGPSFWGDRLAALTPERKQTAVH
jgi:hypothetical protein